MVFKALVNKFSGFLSFDYMGKVIAIDGPAGSGKSTTARLVARKLSWIYIDTGAMYRAVALLALRKSIPASDGSAILKVLKESDLKFDFQDDKVKVTLNSEDISTAIRTPEVTDVVSEVSALPEIREYLVEIQRSYRKDFDLVMEGRDIGTHVFPDAEFKFFLTASIEERARRRLKDFQRQGKKISLKELMKKIQERDYYDSHRQVSPLKKAEDAVEVDTTDMTIEEQVNFIVNFVREKIFRKEDKLNG